MSDADDISVREAVEVDLARVHQIFNQIILNTTATFEEHTCSLDSWRQIFDQKRGGGFLFMWPKLETWLLDMVPMVHSERLPVIK